jgi:hypothetical protein
MRTTRDVYSTHHGHPPLVLQRRQWKSLCEEKSCSEFNHRFRVINPVIRTSATA